MVRMFFCRTQVVAFAEKLEEAEEFANLVVVLQVLPVRTCVRHSQPLRLVRSLERVQVKDAKHEKYNDVTNRSRPIMLNEPSHSVLSSTFSH